MTDTTPPTLVRYRVLALLLALSFLTYFDRVCIVRLQTLIEADLGISRPQMGIILGAFWLAYAVFEIPAGWLGDRYGARLALTRVVLAWSLFTALTGVATGFTTLLAIRLLFGAGEAGAYPNMARVQATWLSPEVRARAGGMLWLAARWGGAFSPLLIGVLLRWFDAHPVPGFEDAASWRLCFAVAGLLGVVWCLAFTPWFRDDPADHRAVNDAELALIREGRPTAETGHGQLPPGVWSALATSRSLWALMFLYVFGSFGWSFFVSWMPRYLLEAHGVAFDTSESLWKQPLLYGGLSCFVGGWLCDWLVRRTGRKRLARAVFPICGCLAAASAVFAVRFAPNADVAVALLCFAGAAYDFGQAANWASIVDVGGRYAGVATGLINLGNLGNVVQPYVGAWVVERYSWNTLFALLAWAFLLAASMWFVIDPTRTFYDDREDASAKRR
ncbi:MAG: MFS transporter [Gemmataceae bacterium]